MASTFPSDYPWVKRPAIINASMANAANPCLAIAVQKAGGIGMLGATPAIDEMRSYLQECSESLLGHSPPTVDETLPVGFGALLFRQKLPDVAALVNDYRPAAVWLFGAHNNQDYAPWAKELRSVFSKTRIWIQVNSVSDAVELAKLGAPDVLVLQGADAGGHGSAKNAGIISLLPETSDKLQREGFGHIPLMAAGGIVDGRGAAAAFALGADGVVIGTRFLCTPEIKCHPQYQAAVLETSDGGQNTVRSQVFDELAGPSIWPPSYDGRAIVAASFRDHTDGMSIDEIRRLHKDAKAAEHGGFGAERRAAIWAGTGVGLVNEMKPAGQIVEDVRKDALTILEKAQSRLRKL